MLTDPAFPPFSWREYLTQPEQHRDGMVLRQRWQAMMDAQKDGGATAITEQRCGHFWHLATTMLFDGMRLADDRICLSHADRLAEFFLESALFFGNPDDVCFFDHAMAALNEVSDLDLPNMRSVSRRTVWMGFCTFWRRQYEHWQPTWPDEQEQQKVLGRAMLMAQRWCSHPWLAHDKDGDNVLSFLWMACCERTSSEQRTPAKWFDTMGMVMMNCLHALAGTEVLEQWWEHRSFFIMSIPPEARASLLSHTEAAITRYRLEDNIQAQVLPGVIRDGSRRLM